MPLTHAQHESPYWALFQKSKRLGWDPAAIDLSADRAQWQRIVADHQAERFDEQILRLGALFHAGEESVTTTLAPFCSAVSRLGLGLDKEVFLTSQLYEEAKHFEFFDRYFREVFDRGATEVARHVTGEPQAVLIDDLAEVTERLRREDDPDRLRATFVEAITHYMGIVEAMLARTGYLGAHEALATRGWLPGLQEGFRLIRRDEGRHVAFGMRCVHELCESHPELGAVVSSTMERHLPNVLATVSSFDYPVPLVDVGALSAFALTQYQRFMAAAGLGGDAAPDLSDEE